MAAAAAAAAAAPPLLRCDTEGCGFTCALRGSLIKHARTHTGEKPFYCESCGFTCAVRIDLIAHALEHATEFAAKAALRDAAIVNAIVKSARAPASGKMQIFKCTEPNCFYFTARRDGLVRHLRTHTGEKPYECTEAFCTFACTRSSRLKQHMASEHGGAQ